MQQNNSQLIASPNPVSEMLNIDFNAADSEGIINILTLDGKLVYWQKTDSGNSTTVNLSHLPQGIYRCQFVGSAEIKTIKIIKK